MPFFFSNIQQGDHCGQLDLDFYICVCFEQRLLFLFFYLLALERVEGGTGSNNLTKLITSFWTGSGAMLGEDIYAKLLLTE